MNNFNFTALIWPTQMESKELHESIVNLENSCRCEYYDASGKLAKCWKDNKNNHMDIYPNGKILIITG